MILKLAEKMKEYGVVPELECFDMGMINYGLYLISKGVVEGPFYWNLLFGNIAGFQANLRQMGTALAEIPSDHFVGLAGLAGDQLKVNASAIAMGYGVRVGIEDNIWWDNKRTRLASNTELIKRIHNLMDIHGKEIMTSSEFGAMGFYNRSKIAQYE
jgi:3-keto-5-aminohexanoate cleavage enzyme